MAIAFEYAREFKDTSIEKVLSKILAWLGKEGVQKVKSTGPTSIEAMHGTFKTTKPYERDGKKKLSFSLSSSGRNVMVNVSVRPSMAILDDIALRREETRANWGSLIEELWSSIEVSASGKDRENRGPRQNLPNYEEEEKRMEATKKGGKIIALIGALDLVTFSTIAIILYAMDTDVPLILFAIPIIAAIVLLFWGSREYGVHRQGPYDIPSPFVLPCH